MIQALQDEARRAGKSMRLHVHTFSRAISLYRRLGFTDLAEKGLYLEMVWRPANVEFGKSIEQSRMERRP
jgi:hypothetical protein